MKPSEFYDNLLKSLTDELEQKVFRVLSHRLGRPVTRVELVEAVFGIIVSDPATIANSPQDRKVRKCIERLRAKSFPIVSTSGEAGYELCDDPNRINAYVAEEASRIENIQDKIGHLRKSVSVATALREWRAEVGVPVQEKLF